MKLDKTDKIAFPSTQKWAEFYVAWLPELLNSLGSRSGEADRRDTIAFAFDKIMNRKKFKRGQTRGVTWHNGGMSVSFWHLCVM